MYRMDIIWDFILKGKKVILYGVKIVDPKIIFFSALVHQGVLADASFSTKGIEALL